MLTPTARVHRTPIGAPRTRSVVTALLFLVVGVFLGGATAVSAAPAADGTVQWSVSPVKVDGQDQRRVINVDLEPGDSAADAIVVKNLGAEDVEFFLTANDGYRTAAGSFDMRSSSHVPVDGGSWISLDDTVKVPAGGEATVAFTVTVPENATPGDHLAGVAASIRSSSTDQVATEHRLGVRVNIRVAGELRTAAEMIDASASYSMSWNPFAAGSFDLTASVVNSGNVRFVGALAGTADPLLGPAATADAGTNVEFMAGETRQVTTRIEQAWPFGPTEVTLVLQPTVSGVSAEDAAGLAMEPVSVTVTVWALPIPQLLVLLALAGLVVLVIAARRRSRRRLEALLEQARNEGVRARHRSESESD